jgi:adenylate cyclase
LAALRRVWPAWLHERRARLTTGVVLFAFATSHFLNAGMGLFGVEAADAYRRINGAFWSFPPVFLALYLSLTVHFLLGLKSVALRRNWRMPPIEATQIVLGLLIPLWLVSHIVATRGVRMGAGIQQTYEQMFLIMWPDLALGQATLLLLVWIHGCIGLYMVLRLRPWFAAWREALLTGAVAVPLIALSGFMAGMREATLRFKGPTITEAQIAAFNNAKFWLDWFIWISAGATIAVLLYRLVSARFGASLTIRYADGPTLRVAPGATLLEMSRLAGVPHASVCGGRARCSTCRVRILDSSGELPAPNQAERRLLARIGAPDSVRLACQLVPRDSLSVQRLVDAGEAARRENHQQDPFRWGVERNVTVMFADIRGFTSIAERSYAFDVVFVLNRFLSEMSAAIEASGGRIDKYLGDGLMAIFGAEGAQDGGSRQALAAVQAMGTALDALNREFQPLLGAELRIGVGVHTGSAILGRIGGGARTAALTALGDTVNIAARLEELTKSLAAVSVISGATFAAAGVDGARHEAHEVAIRGRVEPLQVRAIKSFEALTIA